MKIDFRLVPDQNPEEIAASLRKYLDDNGFCRCAAEGDGCRARFPAATRTPPLRALW